MGFPPVPKNEQGTFAPAGALPPFLEGVRIEIGPIPDTLEGATRTGVLWQAAPGRFLLDVPDIARYLVNDRQRIIVQPVPGADPTDIKRFLRMAPLAALLHLRGILASHAAAAATPHGGILLAGESCVGKSVLLAALLNRGWTMLADDLAPVDLDSRGKLVVLPTFPEIQLRPDVAQSLAWVPSGALGGAARTAARVGGSSRAMVTLPAQFIAPGPVPLHAVYWLSEYSGDDVKVADAETPDPFGALAAVTYNSIIADALVDPASFFPRLAAASGSVRFRLLGRPRSGWSVDQLADAVERSASEHVVEARPAVERPKPV